MSDIAQRTQEALWLYRDGSDPSEAKVLELVIQGVNVHEVDNNQATLLHQAVFNGHPKVCAELIKQGADINACARWDSTPLHRAATNTQLGACKWLIEHGAEIHARDKWDNTLLHNAAYWNSSKIVEYLLAQGANIWAKNDNGKTVLDRDNTKLVERHRNEWLPKLEKVKDGDCREIKTVTDIYHLASVMHPSNPHDIPHPKEFIRRLFLQYIPHNAKFAHLYEAVFSETRPPELDLQKASKEAKGREVAL